MKKASTTPKIKEVQALKPFLNGILFKAQDGKKDFFEDDLGQKLKQWIQLTLTASLKKAQMVEASFENLVKAITQYAELAHHEYVGNVFQDYWMEKFLNYPNLFHDKAEKVKFASMGDVLKNRYLQEIKLFREFLWQLDKMPHHPPIDLWSPKAFRPLVDESANSFLAQSRMEIKKQILDKAIAIDVLVKSIADYFFRCGQGKFARFTAFRWHSSASGPYGELVGIARLDPIGLNDLVGYEEIRQPLLDNIQAFLDGKSANNVLIYGDRGTGKSSTVKALLNEYASQGLRLIEVSVQALKSYFDILKEIAPRHEKFILFIDDMSFEENETSYKELKGILEGSLESKPTNVILIATSNRRHLIRETFQDHQEGHQQESDIHGEDTVQEKLSLADRFGLVISFYAANQETYLRIVEKWAKKETIAMPLPELHRLALQWALRYNQRSGRTARQFILNLKSSWHS